MEIMNSSGHISGKTLGKLHSLQFQLCPPDKWGLPKSTYGVIWKIKQVRSEAPSIVAGRSKGSINRTY